MWQIKINGILMPTIYWNLKEAIDACEQEKSRFAAIITEIVYTCQN